nr:hypothetical protein Iba_chr12aCG2190 [Ipomoea batatas]
MSNFTVFVPLTTRPPLHVLQKLDTIFPDPLHCGQVACTVKRPVCWNTWPDPLQRLQVSGLVPGKDVTYHKHRKVTQFGMQQFCCTPEQHP